MEIAVIGHGNVGTHLAERAKAVGHVVHTLSHTVRDVPVVDMIVLCVKDDAIAEVASHLPADVLVVHTSGSTSMDVLPQIRRGVVYPLQTFTKGVPVEWEKIPLFTEGDPMVAEFAESLRTCSVQPLNSANRLRLHMAAVWACNFANHCMALGAEQMTAAGLDWKLLLPLIDATTAKVHKMHPREGQTGPAVRNDQRVMALHENALEGDLKQIYTLLSKSIQSR